MIRSSLLLSLLTAMFASEPSSSTASATPPKPQSQSTLVLNEVSDKQKTEEQQIVEDARRSIGKDLCDL